MDLPEAERDANNMMASGVYCPSNECKSKKHEMEQVTGFLRYTCHWCGGVVEYDNNGNIVEAWFEGFE